jgi:hypothetical protein
MANNKRFVVENGLETQNISFVSDSTTHTIQISMLDSDTLSVTGNSGQLFSITDSLTGLIFAVNDISGVPSIEIYDTGKIQLAELFGNVLIGTSIDNGVDKLQISGSLSATVLKSTIPVGTAPLQVASATVVTNLNADLLDGYQSSTSNAPSTVPVRDSNNLVSVSGLRITTNEVGYTPLDVLKWNETDKTYDFSLMNGVTGQIFQEQHFYGRAVGDILNGEVVMFAGAQGDQALFTKADVTAIGFQPRWVIGIATQNILNNEWGYVTTLGKVRDLLLYDYPAGTILYLNPTVPGGFTSVEPTSPNPKIVVAAVLRQSTSPSAQNGILLVRPDFGYHLYDLHDVRINGVTDGQVLSWSAANSRWQNSPVSSSLNISGDSGTDSVSLLTDTLSFVGTDPVNTAITNNTVSISIADASASTKGIASFSATDFTVTAGAVSINVESIQDTVGNMVSSNTESGISVTYDDATGKLNFDVADPTITLTGDVTGSATMTNLGNVSITTTIAANSVALGTDTTGNYVAGITAGSGITITGTAGEGWTPTISHTDTSSVTNLAIDNSGANVLQDISVTFDTFGHVTAITTGSIDLDTRYYQKSEVDNLFVNVSGDTLTGFLTLHSGPSQALHAATKQYVDEVAQGIAAKPAVKAATTGNLSATYNNGTLGVGATLTATVNGVIPDIDGVTFTTTLTGILVKNQTNAAHNGRYYISDLGSASTPWVLTRCGYCDEASEIPSGYVFVQEGTTQANTGWVAVVPTLPMTVGTTAINWTQFSGVGTYTAGGGLTLTGTQFSHTDTSSVSNLAANGRTYVTGLTFDTFGHVTGYSTGTETVVDTNTTYSAGTGLSLSGTTFNHSNVVVAGTASEGGVTRNLAFGDSFSVPSVTYDAQGHVTAKGSVTLTLPTVNIVDTNTTYNISAEATTGGANFNLNAGGSGSGTDTIKLSSGSNVTVAYVDANTISISSVNTTYTAGSGLTLVGTQFSHADTSSVANLSATARTYVTGLTFDTFGHVTAVSTATETVVDTNTTYVLSAETSASGAGIKLTGSNALSDTVTLVAGTNVSITRNDSATITISANDTSIDWSEIQNKPSPVITLAGDLTGSVTLTGLTSGTLTAQVVDNSHNHTTLTGVTSIAFAAEATDNASISTSVSGSNTFFDFNLADDSSQTDTWRWRFTPSGGTVFSAMELDVISQGVANLTVPGTITATSFSGNATTASTLQTSRTIAISGPVTGTATSFNGSANITIPVTAVDVGHANITGILSFDHGGTGVSSYTKGDMLYASATNTVAKLPIGTNGQILQANDQGLPVWGEIDGGTF